MKRPLSTIYVGVFEKKKKKNVTRGKAKQKGAQVEILK